MILNHHHPFWSFFAPNNALPRRSQRRDGRGRGGRGGVGGGKGTRKCAPPHSSSSSFSVMSTRCVLCCGDAQIGTCFPNKWLNPHACFKNCMPKRRNKIRTTFEFELAILHNYCNNAGVSLSPPQQTTTRIREWGRFFISL